MRLAHIATLAAAVAGLVLVGCDDTTSAPKADSKPAAVKSTAPAAPADAAPTAEQTALLGKLRSIKPELTLKEDRALRRADSVCDDVRAGKDAATLAKNANFRYSGGTAGQLTNAQGAQIVDAVKATICK